MVAVKGKNGFHVHVELGGWTAGRPSFVGGRSSAIGLGNAPEVLGLIQDLEESIAFGRESLFLLPVDHPDRYETLDTLAKTIHFKPEHLDEASALELSRKSVSAIPPLQEAVKIGRSR